MLWITVALAQEVGGGGEVDANLTYLWRGLKFSEGPVIQPSVWLSLGTEMGDGEFGVWASQALTNDASAIFEIDPSASWTFYTGPVELTPSIVGYLYPTSMADSSLEVGAEVGYPVGIFRFYTGHFFEIVAAPGSWYGTLGGSVEGELPASLWVNAKLELAFASATYNDYYLGVDKTGAETVGVGAEVGWAPGAFYMRLHGETAYWMMSELGDAAGTKLPVNVGLALGLEL